jgi:hypothetical protein
MPRNEGVPGSSPGVGFPPRRSRRGEAAKVALAAELSTPHRALAWMPRCTRLAVVVAQIRGEFGCLARSDNGWCLQVTVVAEVSHPVADRATSGGIFLAYRSRNIHRPGENPMTAPTADGGAALLNDRGCPWPGSRCSAWAKREVSAQPFALSFMQQVWLCVVEPQGSGLPKFGSNGWRSEGQTVPFGGVLSWMR